ncbi:MULTISPECIES: hypothetical protein [Brevibacillus]|uniref:hypothetical protein n=1 Tax=Brevibacillus TaxID=55080 RepID=UPI0031586675
MTRFVPQSFLQEAVSERNIKKIRVALSSYLTKNPSNENNEVLNAVHYVEERITESLWEPHDWRKMEEDRSKWTKDYLGLLKSDLRNNFSKERFHFIIEVGKVVRPSTRSAASPSGKVTTTDHSRRLEQDGSDRAERRTDLGKKQKIWLVIAGLGGFLLLLTWMIRK